MPMNDNYNSSRPKGTLNSMHTNSLVCMQPSKCAVQNILNYARCIQHIRIQSVDIRLNLN